MHDMDPELRKEKAASIMGDGEAAEIAKPYANLYQICACVHIWPMLFYTHIAPIVHTVRALVKGPSKRRKTQKTQKLS